MVGGNIVTRDKEKAKILLAFFVTLISHKEMVSDLLLHLDGWKFMKSDGIHPRLWSELADMLAKPLHNIYQQSWLPVPVDWWLENVTPIYKKGWKQDLGKYRSA